MSRSHFPIEKVLYPEYYIKKIDFHRLPARTREGQRGLRPFAAGQDVDAVHSIIIVHLICLAFFFKKNIQLSICPLVVCRKYILQI